MKIIFFILVLLFNWSQKSWAQSGCIDSIISNHFVSPYFGYPLPASKTVRDQDENLYINGYGNPPGEGNYNIAKFNSANELVWFRTFKTSIFTQVYPQILNGIDGKANLIFISGASNNVFTSILKFDSAATFLWSKRFQRSDFPLVNGNVAGLCTDNSDDIYLYGTYSDDIPKTNIVRLDRFGNILWSKKYGNTNLPKFHGFEKHLVSQNATTIVLFHHFFYDADLSNDPAAKHGLQMVKINKADGTVLDQKTIMYYNDAGGASQNIFTLKKVNFNPVTGTFLLDSWGQFAPPIYRSHIFTSLNTNLDIIKTESYTTNFINPSESINISPQNEVILTVNRPYVSGGSFENSLYYIALNENLEIITQKKINLTNLSFPDNSFIANIAFKKDGIINFQLSLGASVVTNNPIYLFDNSPFYQNLDSYCLGKDTMVYIKSNIYTTNITNVNYQDIVDVPFTSTSTTPDPFIEKAFSKNEICKEVSICDTIKLLGTNYHCLSSPLDSFKIVRNPLCKRITSWQVDTSYIKILNQNDTALYVEYKRPYRGKIKASFGGCFLTDSIAIEVYNPKTGVNLGNDTMYCPSKTITLKADKDFKTYLWQDGSTKDSLVTTQPGTYNITAIDSCGNTFKDTLVISPFDVVLKADYAKALCPGDTATLTLPNQLTNYSWAPPFSSSLNNFTWRLYPPITTTYSISGERMTGCLITDTVLINVKPICIPDYIYFPNAFTPDNNGLNDTYKPGFNGQLVVYEFLIYNRYGQLVFKTTDPINGWDGSFKNSSKPLIGTYVWSCKYQFVGRPVQQEQGTFTLIR